MAPIVEHVEHLARSLLQKRCASGQYRDSYGYCRSYSSWYWYGRWVFAAIVIILFLALFFLWTSRRRRRRGVAPYYGTGWMAPNHGQYHNNPQGYNQPPPPAYGAPNNQSYPMTNHYQSSDGMYRGGQDSGVEAPKNVYTGDYAPPAGPPPGK
ncbi:chitin synthesis regulation, resistance to congo red-domain-containing protein [Xylariaceae sp. FL1272]|nr:chitin synthesis regulation, resistance to congo red-domain-containing protein [Xylariaceae sp. FL1272]